jgi:hypothetical protein
MEIKLAGRVMPRSEKGDVKFVYLNDSHMTAEPQPTADPTHVSGTFTPEEIVELVNRAIYQLEYQAAAHRKRGQAERDRMKALKAALKAQGVDPKRAEIDKQLKGE